MVTGATVTAVPPGPRLALFYGALFGAVGIQLPFWPVWLESRGLGAAAIGVVLAAALWAKVVANPLAARIADRYGEQRPVMIALAAGAAAGTALFALAHGFWPLLCLTIVTAACFTSLMPLGDNLAMLHVRRGAADYGRVRLWGSVAFIVAAVLGGRFVGLAGADAILLMLVVAHALVLLACLALPEAGPAEGTEDGGAGTGVVRAPAVRQLLGAPGFLLLLAAAGLIQASHSAYYAIATLYWRAAGHDDLVIGWLWAEGVIAEIALFAFARPLLQRFDARRLLVAAGLLAALRWALTGTGTALALLLAVQVLHAASFAVTHLAAVYEIQRIAPPGLSATAQGLYSAYGAGAVVGLVMPATGWLYDAFGGGGAFHAMAVVALAGAVLAAFLAARDPCAGAPPPGPDEAG